MNTFEAEKLLRQVRYKAGYTLMWDTPFKDRDILRVWWNYERPDCNNPDQVGVGRSGDQLVDLVNTTPEGLLRQVFGMTLRLEEHEAREWFMVGDLRMFDPHKSLLNEGARWSAELPVDLTCFKCLDGRPHLFHEDGSVNRDHPDADEVPRADEWLDHPEQELVGR